MPTIDDRQRTTDIKNDILIPNKRYAIPPIRMPKISATAKKDALLKMLSCIGYSWPLSRMV